MNLLLLESKQETYEFPPEHPNTDRIRRLSTTEICVGVVNGPRGIGTFHEESDGTVRIRDMRWEATIHPASELDLIVGLPRPSDAKRILFHTATIGVRSVGFVVLDRTPEGYAESRAMAPESVAEVFCQGLEQGFRTALPHYRLFNGLDEVLGSFENGREVVVLDPYLATGGFCGVEGKLPAALTLVMGSERGFSPKEQETIRGGEYRVRHLGPSILRSEAAVIAALAIAYKSSGYWDSSERSVIKSA